MQPGLKCSQVDVVTNLIGKSIKKFIKKWFWIIMNQIETSKPRRSLEKQSLDGDTRKRVKWNKRGANREREKKCPQSISGK